eukprot:1907033-Pyramimonas_sp.AAC.1
MVPHAMRRTWCPRCLQQEALLEWPGILSCQTTGVSESGQILQSPRESAGEEDHRVRELAIR